MKFGKKFVSEMVPEWQNAYMEYDHLKTFLKEILREKQRSSSRQPEGLRRAMTLYRAFSGLVQRHNHVTSHNASARTDDIDHQAILATSIGRDGSERYETLFLMAVEDGGELELVFFNKLGHEFNKVDRFYKSMVREVVSEAEMLSKQMDMLIAFRVKVDNFEEFLPKDSGEMLHKTKPTTPVAPVEILSNVKLNKILDTPLSVIEGCLDPSNQTEPNFSRKNLKKAERQLKQAFIEFYHKLQLLKIYRHLNISAFSKIMKKYDKITSRNTSRTYMNMVDKSYLGHSDEVPKLLKRVEATYIKHFSKSNREKAMDTLRPKAKRETEKHFSWVRCIDQVQQSLFVGCNFALVLSLVLIIRARGILNRKGQAQYMDNMFPLYSLFAFIVLHMVIYAANIYFWRRYRINYPFIFGVKQGTELGYREVLLVSFGLAVLALASVLSNLDMEMDPKTNEYKALTELVPLCLVALVILVLLCPLNIVYRSSRYFLVTSLFHCICAPLYKVTFHDSFIIDQLTSQVQAFRSLEFYICYYGWGDYKLRQNTCKTSDVYNTFYFIIAVIPYWSRLLQCLRRLYEEKDKMQGYNGLKCFITIVAVCTRTAYSLDKGILRKSVAAIFSGSAAIYCTYWDLVIDWGLLQSHSKNRFLRDKLLIPYKGVYFGAMVLDVLLRFAWLQTVLDFQVSFLHRQTLISIVASLEIIRRGLWNFFRLENEHLHNVGKYRAFKFVPLPFELDVGAEAQEQ